VFRRVYVNRDENQQVARFAVYVFLQRVISVAILQVAGIRKGVEIDLLFNFLECFTFFKIYFVL